MDVHSTLPSTMVGTVVQAVTVVDVLWERLVLGGDVLAAADEDSSVVVWSVVEFAVVLELLLVWMDDRVEVLERWEVLELLLVEDEVDDNFVELVLK
jgi:hypothetical protein